MKTIKEIKLEKVWDEVQIASLNSRVPDRYQGAEIGECPDFVRHWAFGPRDKNSLYLWGPVGTGKTYCAYAIFRLLTWNKITSRATNSTALLQDIRDDYKYGSKDTQYQSKFDSWVDFKGVLVIDDIGSEKPTEWVLETFYSLINTRYESDLPTVFTSNYSIEELASRLGDRIASRIVEMCEIKKIDGEDRRLK